MATTLTPGTRRRASTWAAPMKPEPMTATLTGGICARRRNGRCWPAAAPRTEREQRERNVSGASPRAQPHRLARVLNGLAFVLRPAHVAENMPRQDQTWATAWSLEYRLPILISLLLACVVGGLSLAAYRQVRATSLDRATEVMERVEHELVVGATRSNLTRLELLRSLADDSLFVHATTHGAAADAIEKRFAATSEAKDSTLVGWQLSSVDGKRRYGSASGWTLTDSAELARTLAGVVRSEA